MFKQHIGLDGIVDQLSDILLLGYGILDIVVDVFLLVDGISCHLLEGGNVVVAIGGIVLEVMHDMTNAV